jgi:hypothetical protein
MSEPSSQLPPLPGEVVAFCQLLARIVYRCLQEQDPRVLDQLGLPTAPPPSEEARRQSPSEQHERALRLTREQDPPRARPFPRKGGIFEEST